MAKITHAAVLTTQEFYDKPRDLLPHEQELLTAVHFAGRERDACVGAAVKLFGDKSQAYWATVNLADRSEASALDKALAVYVAAEDDIYYGVQSASERAFNEAVDYAEWLGVKWTWNEAKTADELNLIDFHETQQAAE